MSISINLGITSAVGKKSTKAYTDINPNASNSQLVTFADAVNDLTTNTLTSLTKITKQDIPRNSYPATIQLATGGSINISKVDNYHFNVPVADISQEMGDATYGNFIFDFTANNSSFSFSKDYMCYVISTDSPLVGYANAYGSGSSANTIVNGMIEIIGIDISTVVGNSFSLVIPDLITTQGVQIDRSEIFFTFV